jgi:hypothetical protein
MELAVLDWVEVFGGERFCKPVSDAWSEAASVKDTTV